MWIDCEYIKGKAHGPLEGWDKDHNYFLSSQYKKGKLQKKAPLPPEKRPLPAHTVNADYVDIIVKNFIKEAMAEYGVRPYGIGGFMPCDLEEISVSFIQIKKGTINESRDLLVKLTEKLVDMVNNHKKLRPFLRDYPFTSKRADVSLVYYDSRGLRREDGSITDVLVNRRNEISYLSYNPKNPRKDNKVKESYKDAVKIVYGKND